MRPLIAIALLVVAPAIASAENEPAPERGGIAIEGELGVGVLGASNPIDADLDAAVVAMAGRLGGFVTPRLSLMAVAGLMTGEFDDPDFNGPGGDLTELYLGAALRFWASPKVWLEGQLATSRLIVDRLGFDQEEVFAGARIGVAGGVVLFEGQRLNLDGRLGLATAGYDNEISSGSLWLGVGLTTR